MKAICYRSSILIKFNMHIIYLKKYDEINLVLKYNEKSRFVIGCIQK